MGTDSVSFCVCVKPGSVAAGALMHMHMPNMHVVCMRMCACVCAVACCGQRAQSGGQGDRRDARLRESDCGGRGACWGQRCDVGYL